MKLDILVVWAAKLLYPSPLKGPATWPKEIREISSPPLDTRTRTPYTSPMITPADYPCQCRACGVMILDSVTDMCPDCEDDMNAYYDDRSAEESEWDEASATADATADAQAEAPYYPPDEDYLDYGDGPDW